MFDHNTSLIAVAVLTQLLSLFSVAQWANRRARSEGWKRRDRDNSGMPHAAE